MTELVTDEEGKLIYNSDALSIDLYQPLFYLIAPIAFLLFLWQISPSSSYLGHFASRFFDIDQFDSLDYGSTGGGGGMFGQKVAEQLDNSIYTPIESLTPQEMEAFKSASFVLGSIPERPPPREFCVAG